MWKILWYLDLYCGSNYFWSPQDAVVLDFSKALNCVPYHRLLRKLHHYGIHNSLLLWMENFLTTRSQHVVVDGASPEWTPVTSSGVPQGQGTVLGPLLFLFFINDLPTEITSQLCLFADDCLIYPSTVPYLPLRTPLLSRKTLTLCVNGPPNGTWSLTQTNATPCVLLCSGTPSTLTTILGQAPSPWSQNIRILVWCLPTTCHGKLISISSLLKPTGCWVSSDGPRKGYMPYGDVRAWRPPFHPSSVVYKGLISSKRA